MRVVRANETRIVGRYVLHDEVACGGMGSVHLGRLRGPAGFSRTVAIKRPHDHFARDPEFVAMLLDEARLAARIRHPNVASVLDVVAADGEVFLVMEFIHGESLDRLRRAVRRRGQRFPLRHAAALLAGVLHGLHAAHEAVAEDGSPLRIVHRDVSPQNVLVGTDGIPKVIDFGVAKAVDRLQTTRDGKIKGKISYMAPEQLLQQSVDRRADVYSAAVVLWELLTGTAMFPRGEVAAMMHKVLQGKVQAPREINRNIPKSLDDLVMRGLAVNAADRFPSARDMALALESAVVPSTPGNLGAWVEEMVGDELRVRADQVVEAERISSDDGRRDDSLNVPLAVLLARHSSSVDGPEADTVSDVGPPPERSASEATELSPLTGAPVVAVGEARLHRHPPPSTRDVRADAPATAESYVPERQQRGRLSRQIPILLLAAAVSVGAAFIASALLNLRHIDRGESPVPSAGSHASWGLAPLPATGVAVATPAASASVHEIPGSVNSPPPPEAPPSKTRLPRVASSAPSFTDLSRR